MLNRLGAAIAVLVPFEDTWTFPSSGDAHVTARVVGH